jgi:hypothetical protein
MDTISEKLAQALLDQEHSSSNTQDDVIYYDEINNHVDICEELGECDHLYAVQDHYQEDDAKKIKFEQVYPDIGLPYYRTVLAGDDDSESSDVDNSNGIAPDQDTAGTQVLKHNASLAFLNVSF